MLFFTRHHALSVIVNILVPIFFFSLFLFKGSYNLVPIGLSVLSIGFVLYAWLSKRPLALPPMEKCFLFSLSCYILIFIVLLLFHQDKLREFENVGKLCLFIPLFYLLHHYRIRLDPLMIGILVGAVLAGVVAIYDRFYLNLNAAYAPRMLQIQAGDMAMSLGLFSVVIGLYSYQIKRYPLAIFSVIATLLGMLGSFLSTARGGWIALPVLILMIMLIYRRNLSKTMRLAFATLFVITLTTAVLIPKTKMLHRVNEAYTEAMSYFSEFDGTTSIGARFDMWKGAILMAKEKPLFGWGAKGALEQSKILAQQGLIHEYVTQFHHAHNQYLDDLAKRGLVGLSALLLVFLIPLSHFYQALKGASPETRAVATLGLVHILSVMSYALTQAFIEHNSGNLFYFFLIAVFYSALYQPDEKKVAVGSH
ncbi:O-antigen ligase family protein [Pasteurella sp. PK-2025]|uniref:O-antigen ligase family protein n=1 Tax=Pasteurella sp. PK-2025 TaxID=3413133 RepID=UPI003C7636F4